MRGLVNRKMIFKCKNCDGNVIYSPEKHKLYCPYCDSIESEERNDDSADALTICPNCYGEIPVTEHMAATQCPCCDSYLIFNERVEGAYEPKLILPFQFGKENCKKDFRAHFKKKKFLPTDFLSDGKLNGMKGLYVPYWFFDYDTNCDFQGEGSKVRTWTSGNVQYTETSYYDVKRNMDINFRKIPADASADMPDEVMDLMEPFNYDKMEDFKPEFMSGFYADKYHMGADTVEDRAKGKMQNDASRMMKASYAGYGNVREIHNRVDVRNSEVSYGFLPVWKYNYKYKGNDYPFYVNGQTGKIIGTAPISKPKVFAYTGTLWGCITLLMLLINGVIRLL